MDYPIATAPGSESRAPRLPASVNEKPVARFGDRSVAALLLPVIFTTATLWVSDSNLSDADVVEGKVDLTSSEFKQMPWIWFAYHTSPGLRHSTTRRTFPATLPQLMDDDYIRHIAIVSSTGIDQFLRWSSDTDSMI